MSKSLYFSRSDLLGDPFEGSYPEFNKEFRVQRDKMFLEQLLGDRVTTDSVNTFLESQSNLNKFLAKCMCVNCWHINEDESFAMWSIYAKDNKGIAIQSTYKQLRTSLPPSILIGKVTYIDYQKEHISEFRVFDPIMHKRKSFMFENELRAVKSILGAFLPTITESLVEVPSVGPDIKGVSIPVDIDKLISSIYVAPNSEDWFFDVVSEVTKQYSLTINVCKSPLDKEPYY